MKISFQEVHSFTPAANRKI